MSFSDIKSVIASTDGTFLATYTQTNARPASAVLKGGSADVALNVIETSTSGAFGIYLPSNRDLNGLQLGQTGVTIEVTESDDLNTLFGILVDLPSKLGGFSSASTYIGKYTQTKAEPKSAVLKSADASDLPLDVYETSTAGEYDLWLPAGRPLNGIATGKEVTIQVTEADDEATVSTFVIDSTAFTVTDVDATPSLTNRFYKYGTGQIIIDGDANATQKDLGEFLMEHALQDSNGGAVHPKAFRLLGDGGSIVPLTTDDLAKEEQFMNNFGVSQNNIAKNLLMIQLLDGALDSVNVEEVYKLQFQDNAGAWYDVDDNDDSTSSTEFHFSRNMTVTTYKVLPNLLDGEGNILPVDADTLTNWWKHDESTNAKYAKYVEDGNAADPSTAVIMFKDEQDWTSEDAAEDEPRPLLEFTVTGGVPIADYATTGKPYYVRIKEAALNGTDVASETNDAKDTLYVRCLSFNGADTTNFTATYRVYARGHAITTDPNRNTNEYTVSIRDAEGAHSHVFDRSFRTLEMPHITIKHPDNYTNMWLAMDRKNNGLIAGDLQYDRALDEYTINPQLNVNGSYNEYWPAASFVSGSGLDRRFHEVYYTSDYTSDNTFLLSDDVGGAKPERAIINDLPGDYVSQTYVDNELVVRMTDTWTDATITNPKLLALDTSDNNAPTAIPPPSSYTVSLRYADDAGLTDIKRERTIQTADYIKPDTQDETKPLYNLLVYYPLRFRVAPNSDNELMALATSSPDYLGVDALRSGYTLITLERFGGLQLRDPILVTVGTQDLQVLSGSDATLLPFVSRSDVKALDSVLLTTYPEYVKFKDEQESDFASRFRIQAGLSSSALNLFVHNDDDNKFDVILTLNNIDVERSAYASLAALVRVKDGTNSMLGSMIPSRQALKDSRLFDVETEGSVTVGETSPVVHFSRTIQSEPQTDGDYNIHVSLTSTNEIPDMTIPLHLLVGSGVSLAEGSIAIATDDDVKTATLAFTNITTDGRVEDVVTVASDAVLSDDKKTIEFALNISSSIFFDLLEGAQPSLVPWVLDHSGTTDASELSFNNPARVAEDQFDESGVTVDSSLDIVPQDDGTYHATVTLNGDGALPQAHLAVTNGNVKKTVAKISFSGGQITLAEQIEDTDENILVTVQDDSSSVDTLNNTATFTLILQPELFSDVLSGAELWQTQWVMGSGTTALNALVFNSVYIKPLFVDYTRQHNSMRLTPEFLSIVKATNSVNGTSSDPYVTHPVMLELPRDTIHYVNDANDAAFLGTTEVSFYPSYTNVLNAPNSGTPTNTVDGSVPAASVLADSWPYMQVDETYENSNPNGPEAFPIGASGDDGWTFVKPYFPPPPEDPNTEDLFEDERKAKINWYLHWDYPGTEDTAVILDGIPHKEASKLTGLYALTRIHSDNFDKLEHVLFPVYTQPKQDGNDKSWFREAIATSGTDITNITFHNEEPDDGYNETNQPAGMKTVFFYLGDAEDYDTVQMFGKDIADSDNFYTSELKISDNRSWTRLTPRNNTAKQGVDLATLSLPDIFDSPEDVIMALAPSTNSGAPTNFGFMMLEAGWTYNGTVQRLRMVKSDTPRKLHEGNYAPIGEITAPYIPSESDHRIVILPNHEGDHLEVTNTSSRSNVAPRDHAYIGGYEDITTFSTHDDPNSKPGVIAKNGTNLLESKDEEALIRWNDTIGWVLTPNADHVKHMNDDVERQKLLGLFANLKTQVSMSYARSNTETIAFLSEVHVWGEPQLYVARTHAGPTDAATGGNFVRLNTLENHTDTSGYIVVPYQHMAGGNNSKVWVTSLRYIGGAYGWNTDTSDTGDDTSSDDLRQAITVTLPASMNDNDGNPTATLNIANITPNDIDFDMTLTITDTDNFPYGAVHDITLALPEAELDGATLWSAKTFTVKLVVNKPTLRAVVADGVTEEQELGTSNNIIVNSIGSEDDADTEDKEVLLEGNDEDANVFLNAKVYVEGTYQPDDAHPALPIKDFTSTPFANTQHGAVRMFLAHSKPVNDVNTNGFDGTLSHFKDEVAQFLQETMADNHGGENDPAWQFNAAAFNTSNSALEVVDGTGDAAADKVADGETYFNKIPDTELTANALLVGVSETDGEDALLSLQRQVVDLNKGVEDAKFLAVSRVPYKDENGNRVVNESAMPYAFVPGERDFYFLYVDETGAYGYLRLRIQSTSNIQRVGFAMTSQLPYRLTPGSLHDMPDCGIGMCTMLKYDGVEYGWDKLAKNSDVNSKYNGMRDPALADNASVDYADNTELMCDWVLQRRKVNFSDTQGDLFHLDTYKPVRAVNNEFDSDRDIVEYENNAVATVRLNGNNPVLVKLTFTTSRLGWLPTHTIELAKYAGTSQSVPAVTATGIIQRRETDNKVFIVEMKEADKDTFAAIKLTADGVSVKARNKTRGHAWDTTGSYAPGVLTTDGFGSSIAESWSTILTVRKANQKDLNEALKYYPLPQRPYSADKGYGEDSTYDEYFQYQLLARNRFVRLGKGTEEYRVSETIGDCYRTYTDWQSQVGFFVGTSAAVASTFVGTDTVTRRLYVTAMQDERLLPRFELQGMPVVGQTWAEDWNDLTTLKYTVAQRGVPLSEQNDGIPDGTKSVYAVEDADTSVLTNPQVRVPADLNVYQPFNEASDNEAQVVFLGNTGPDEQVSATLVVTSAQAGWAVNDQLKLTIKPDLDNTATIQVPATISDVASSNTFTITLGRLSRTLAIAQTVDTVDSVKVINETQGTLEVPGSVALAAANPLIVVRVALTEQQPSWAIGQNLIFTYDYSGTKFVATIAAMSRGNTVVHVTMLQSAYDALKAEEYYNIRVRNFDAGTYTPVDVTGFNNETTSVKLSLAPTGSIPTFNINDIALLFITPADSASYFITGVVTSTGEGTLDVAVHVEDSSDLNDAAEGVRVVNLEGDEIGAWATESGAYLDVSGTTFDFTFTSEVPSGNFAVGTPVQIGEGEAFGFITGIQNGIYTAALSSGFDITTETGTIEDTITNTSKSFQNPNRPV